MNNYKNIYLAELEDFLDENADALLLDVRQEYEFQQFALEGAKLIPLPELESRALEIDKFKDKLVVVYCKAGVRSIYACQILHQLGFNNLYNLADGVIGLYH